ncbi:MAG: hypothetical protein ACMUIP_15635 [bacterium]
MRGIKSIIAIVMIMMCLFSFLGCKKTNDSASDAEATTTDTTGTTDTGTTDTPSTPDPETSKSAEEKEIVDPNTGITLQVAGIMLEADPPSIPADGSSTSTITADVSIVGGGSPPDGTSVQFTIIDGGGKFGGNTTVIYTITNGVAEAVLTSDPSVGRATIRVVAGGKTAKIDVEYAPGSVSLSIIPNSLLGTGDVTADIVATVALSDGTSADNGDPVMFTLSDGTLGYLTDLSGTAAASTTTSEGEARIVFNALTKEGELTVVATWITSTGDEIEGSAIINIQPPPADIQMAECSPDPAFINVKGTGGEATSMVIFDVIDARGNSVADGYRIDFSLISGPNGGETIIPTSTRTVNGHVSTILRSGYKSGPVSIKATYYNDSRVNSISSEIAISAGPPVGEGFAIWAEYLNIAGFWLYDLEDKISVGISDIYGNAIPDGTAISLTTYNTGGFFDVGSASTEKGRTSGNLVSSYPKPMQGFVSVTAEAINGGRTTRVSSLAVTPSPDNHIMYAATNGGGIYKSIDGGLSWSNISRSSEARNQGQNWLDPYVNDVAVDPDYYNTVYAATGYLGKGRIFRSLDGGLNWNSDNTEEFCGISDRYDGISDRYDDIFESDDMYNGAWSSNAAILNVLIDGDDNADTDYPYIWAGSDGLGALFAPDGEHFRCGGIVDAANDTVESPEGYYTRAGNSGDGGIDLLTLSAISKSEVWTLMFNEIGFNYSTPDLSDDVSHSNADGEMVLALATNFEEEDDEDEGVFVENETWTVTYEGDFDATGTNIGDTPGSLTVTDISANTLTETWTVEFYSVDASGDATFTVYGDRSGRHNNYEVADGDYSSDNNEVTFFITADPSDDFEAGDRFEFDTTADAWTVTGSSSGTLPQQAKTNLLYESDQVNFTITSGANRFYRNGDYWEFDTEIYGNWLVWGSVSGLQNKRGNTDELYTSDYQEVSFYIDASGDAFEDGDYIQFAVTESGLGNGKIVRDIVKVPGTHGANAVLYAGTATGVYRSSTGGLIWEKCASFTGNSITTLELHPTSNGTTDILYAGTEDAGVWVSEDSGQLWTRYSEGMGKGLSASVPIPDSGNKGNGTMTEVTVDPNTRTEKWTVTYAGNDLFSVSGTLSGVQEDATSGVTYPASHCGISFTIYEKKLPFEVGDSFSFITTRDPGAHIKDLLVDGVNNKLYAITYFWGEFEPHAVGNLYVHTLTAAGAMTDDAWEEANSGLPQYDPPDDTTLFAQHALAVDNPDSPGALYIGGEGINLLMADVAHSLTWKESKTGLTNLIMARMPILFSGVMNIDIDCQCHKNNYYIITIYIQDINGNPPVSGSKFLAKRYNSVTKETETFYDIEYLDGYFHKGTFRDPSNIDTKNPYVIYTDLYPDDKITVTFISKGDRYTAPGNSGTGTITKIFQAGNCDSCGD